MNVSLTPQLEQFVRTKVESGRYNSSSEVVREALRLLEQYDAVHEFKLAALRADIEQPIGEAERGDVVAYDAASIKRAGRERRAAEHG